MNYQLIAKIPGVKVTIMPDPLNAKVELTEAAKREFAWRMIMEDVFGNTIYSAYHDLDPKNKSFFDSLKRQKNPQQDAFRKLESYVKMWFGEDETDGDDGVGDKLFERLKDWSHVNFSIEELNMPHAGDCTAVACSCSRCQAESVLGINTLLSGKHVNYRLAGMYFEETATQEAKDEAARKKQEFAEKYPSPMSAVDREAMIKAHQPRWDREAATAKEVYALHKTLIGTTGESK